MGLARDRGQSEVLSTRREKCPDSWLLMAWELKEELKKVAHHFTRSSFYKTLVVLTRCLIWALSSLACLAFFSKSDYVLLCAVLCY